jgi:hypothetical protein
MCAGFPRASSSKELPHGSLTNKGPGDPGRIGNNLRVVGKIICDSLNNWQRPREGFIK